MVLSYGLSFCNWALQEDQGEYSFGVKSFEEEGVWVRNKGHKGCCCKHGLVCLALSRAFWLVPQTGLVFYKCQGAMDLHVICDPGFDFRYVKWNEWAAFSLLVKRWTQESRPHWRSNHWSNLDQETDIHRDRTVKRQRDSLKRQIASHPLPSKFPIKAIKQNKKN